MPKLVLGACCYTQIFKNGRREFRSGESCFRNCDWDNIKEIQFFCQLEDTFTPAHVRFWIRFLRYWLTDLEWTATECAVGHPKRRVIFYRMKIAPGGKVKNLLYATLFRYPQKYGKTVITLYNERTKADNPEDLFRIFQELHLKGPYAKVDGGTRAEYASSSQVGGTAEDAICCTDYTMGGGNYKATRALSLDEIKTRLREPKPSVYAYWA